MKTTETTWPPSCISVRHLLRMVCLAYGCTFGTALPAQSGTYPFNFVYLSTDNGLPHNYCHTALRDRRGFLWFGTQDGLARYDGVGFKVYTWREDSTGLSAPTVLDLDEDRNGYLWIATVGGGLNRFDPSTETFRWYRSDPRDPATLPGKDLTNLLIDPDGSIWVGGLSSGLSRLDPATGRCRNFALAEGLTTAEDRLQRNSVQDIAADSEDTAILWLAANNGIFRFNKYSGSLQHFAAETPCRDVQADAPGVVWVATDGGGIARFDKKTAKWQYYPPLPREWARRNLATNLISDISWKSKREFWVASLDLGFGIFDLNTGKYTFFNTQSKLLPGQTAQAANGLYRDPSGLLWIFNDKNGVSLLDPANNGFDFTALPGADCQNAKVNEPRDFAWNAARNELYVVTAGCRGLYVFEPVRRVEPVRLSGQSPYRLKYAVGPPGGEAAFFQCILIDSRGRVWIGAQPGASGSALYEYLPEQRQLRPFRFPGPAAAALQRFPVNDLVEDYRHQVWAATTRGGLFRIDFGHRTVDQYLREGDFDGARTQIVDLVCLAEPAETPERQPPPGAGFYVEQVWFSTQEAGVFCFFPDGNKFIRYRSLPDSRKGLQEDHVSAVERGPDGSVWVGTYSQGLQMIPPGAAPDAELPHFTVKDGLAFNSIEGLASAPDNRLWIATEKGISVFNPRTRYFDTFDESDGLADTYLHNKGFRWCKNGEIFVGQSKGFYSIRPDRIYKNRTPPVLAFTGFSLFGRPFSTGKDLNIAPKVQLRHDQNFFTIHFAALNFSQSNRNQYFHRLEGVDPGWISSGNRAEASYTKVPPGKYRFRIRGRNNSGVESAEERVLQIVIEPAFYQTWWFRTLVLAALIAAVMAYFRSRLDRILKQEAAKNELNRLRAVKAELENKALRSQMNPHFIFNALNTIEALIIEEKPEAASALLQKFSKLVRLVLENSQQPRISLALELEALELYIQLEAIRFNGRFQYRIDVDPRLERQRCLIPPLILQPFVENAILHGLRHLREREGLLTVRLEPALPGSGGQSANAGTYAPERDPEPLESAPRILRCRIEDNGIGRAQAAAINARMRIGNKKQSLGARLTTERVDLLSPGGLQQYKVEIADITGPQQNGTVVTLTLPLEYKNATDTGVSET